MITIYFRGHIKNFDKETHYLTFFSDSSFSVHTKKDNNVVFYGSLYNCTITL